MLLDDVEGVAVEATVVVVVVVVPVVGGRVGRKRVGARDPPLEGRGCSTVVGRDPCCCCKVKEYS